MKGCLRFLVIITFWVTIVAGISSCGGGLDPASVPLSATMSGVIHYVGTSSSFPPKDSVRFLTVVAFREIPRDTNVLLTVLRGEAYFLSETLPYGVDSSTFSLEISKVPDTLHYIAVAQQYGANINSDWRVVGIYSVTNDYTPTTVMVVGGQRKNNINISVDFSKIPPQPFKR